MVGGINMMRKTILVLMLAVTGVTGLFAQGGPRGGNGTPPTPEQMVERRVAMLTALLSLDSGQQAQAKTIFTDEATASQALRDKARDANDALQAAVKSSASDAQIEALAAQVGAVHGQSLAIHAKAQSKLRAILNSAQREKLDTTRGGFGGGPRGPGGMGGGMRPQHRGF
jgi:Spy/CpxP family protein refolding chaperone